MRILFLYFNLNVTIGIPNGVSQLSAILKQVGHKVQLITLCEELGYPLDLWRLKSDILGYRPDVVAISALDMQMKYVKTVCDSMTTYYNGWVICGGMGPTMRPDETIMYNGVDAICIGEGDDAFVEWVNAIQNGGDYTSIKNIWVCGEIRGEPLILQNRLRPLKNLSTLPPEDKEISDLNTILPLKGWQLEHGRGRGCVNKCAYCMNHAYLEAYRLYGVGGKCPSVKEYVRSKPIDITMTELLTSTHNHPKIEKIAFIDDDLLLYRDTVEFLRMYKEKINLPFVCNIHPHSVTSGKAEALRIAGCDTVRLGIESGSERVKKEILNRTMSNESAEKAIKLCHDVGLTTSIYIMIGLPTETMDEVHQTLRFIAKLRPDIVKLCLFYPFTGTKLYELCEKLDIIDYEKREKLDSFDTYTCLKFTPEHQLFLRKAQVIFNWYVNMYLEQGNDFTKYYSTNIEVVDKMSEEEFLEYEKGGFLIDDTLAGEVWASSGEYCYTKFVNRSLAKGGKG